MSDIYETLEEIRPYLTRIDFVFQTSGEPSYGLIKLLTTIADQKNFVDAQDLIDAITDVLVTQTEEFDEFKKQVLTKVESFNYFNSSYDNIETPASDLSAHPAPEGCLDLAEHISEVLKDKRTPVNLYNAMVEAMSGISQPADLIDSPEYINMILCRGGEND